MERGHVQPGSLEVNIGAMSEQQFDTLNALFLRLRRLSDHSFSAQVALEANKVETRATVVVNLVDVESAPAFFPLFENPLQASRIAMHGGFVDGQVSIFINCVENLVFLALLLCHLEDFVEQVWFFVGTLGDDAHECKLVLAHYLHTFAAAASHYFCKIF